MKHISAKYFSWLEWNLMGAHWVFKCVVFLSRELLVIGGDSAKDQVRALANGVS